MEKPDAVAMEMDFYTAVDDLKPEEDSGAGMLGVVEFNSSCFYRYAVLDYRSLQEMLGHFLPQSASARLTLILDKSNVSRDFERQMREAAANLEFELAAMLRDQLNELKAMSAPDVRRTSSRIRQQA